MSATVSEASIAEYTAAAHEWLASNAAPIAAGGWGVGSDSLSLFPEWERPESVTWVDDARRWLTARHEAGYTGITLSRQDGGQGLSKAHELAFEMAESEYVTPPAEVWGIGHHMVIPAVARYGTPEQKQQYIRPGLRGELVFCQLFSEPDAGSDLSGLRTAATRDGDSWRLDGQKVWTSVAQVADYGMILCRTDPESSRHHGITCFIVPMHAAGVTVRPIKQITGGHAFNEVFLDGVVVSDADRLGDVGAGWDVARSTLGNERVSVPLNGPHASVERLIDLARHLDRLGDPMVRSMLADLVVKRRVIGLTQARVHEAVSNGADPGAIGSSLKLAATAMFSAMGAAAGVILGPALAADTDRWGTYVWGRHVLESAGLRVGGGTDEIQRNIIAERHLGLPRDPRPDQRPAAAAAAG